jgi:hypothetical protein
MLRLLLRKAGVEYPLEQQSVDRNS